MAAPIALPGTTDRRAASAAEVAALDRDIIEWEIAATKALVWLIAGTIVMLLGISPWIGADLTITQCMLATIAIVHFLLQRYGLQYLSAVNPRRLEVLRWTAATIEVSFASIATLLVVHVHGAVWAATSPVTMVYVLGMVAASFRLRPAMSIYAAVLATAEWLAIYYLVIAPHIDAETARHLSTLEPWAAWERASWILISGVLLTVASRRLRELALANRAQEHARRTAVHELERLVSPNVAERALAGHLVLGKSERRWATVLFCDLRDFTALCEHRRTEDVLMILNAFYERACEIIRAHGGHVNKFLGDGVLALFGAPEKQPDHAHAAVRCARELARAADELRARGGAWQDFEVGIGLDTGDVVLGAVGSEDRLEYTAIGATVNRAARLQALSSTTGRRIVLSARCASELDREDMLLPLGEAKIKGVDRPIRIYTPR